MSGRFDWDGYEPPEYENAAELFEARAVQVLYGKRGRRELAKLREALMALPKHELIDGAMCRRPNEFEEGDRGYHEHPDAVVPPGQVGLDLSVEPAPPAVDSQGHPITEYEVCAVGAYVWWTKVQAGMDPIKAFQELPKLDVGEDGMEGEGYEMFDTAWEGQRAGLPFTLAWELASGNDETFATCTPAERWQKMVDFIDAVQASPPLKRGQSLRGLERLGRSWTC